MQKRKNQNISFKQTKEKEAKEQKEEEEKNWINLDINIHYYKANQKPNQKTQRNEMNVSQR